MNSSHTLGKSKDRRPSGTKEPPSTKDLPPSGKTVTLQIQRCINLSVIYIVQGKPQERHPKYLVIHISVIGCKLISKLCSYREYFRRECACGGCKGSVAT